MLTWKLEAVPQWMWQLRDKYGKEGWEMVIGTMAWKSSVQPKV